MATYVSNRDGGSTDEQGHYRFQVKVWDGNIENGMVVTQNSPLGMSVLVGTGDLKIDYSNYAYTAWNDANSSVTITTADGSNPRIDRIVAYIDRGMTPSVSPPNNQGMLKFMAVAGTPNAVPTRPSDATVNSAVGTSNPWCDLADVRVNAGVTTITNANITDTRVLVSATANSVITASLANSSVTPIKIDSPIQYVIKGYANNSANYSTSGSTTLISVDATNLITTLNVKSGKLIRVDVNITGFYGQNTGYGMNLDIGMDGTSTKSNSGTLTMNSAQTPFATDGSQRGSKSLIFYFTGVSTGSHTFRLLYATTNASYAMYLGQYAEQTITVTELA